MNNYIDMIINGAPDDDIIYAFYNCFPEDCGKNYTEKEVFEADKFLLNLIQKMDVDHIVDVINIRNNGGYNIDASNIPQFSSLESINGIIDIVDANPDVPFYEIGYFFNKNGSKNSQSKYGENHYKIAAAFGLVNTFGNHGITHLAIVYRDLPLSIREDVRKKLSLRISIILMIMTVGRKNIINVSEVMSNYLSTSTVIRRRPNVKRLVADLIVLSKFESNYISNIIWK